VKHWSTSTVRTVSLTGWSLPKVRVEQTEAAARVTTPLLHHAALQAECVGVAPLSEASLDRLGLLAGLVAGNLDLRPRARTD
jgi:hypothetical protein